MEETGTRRKDTGRGLARLPSSATKRQIAFDIVLVAFFRMRPIGAAWKRDVFADLPRARIELALLLKEMVFETIASASSAIEAFKTLFAIVYLYNRCPNDATWRLSFSSF